MSFFLSKFLPLFIYPAGLSIILLLISLIFWKHQKLSKILIIIAFFIILIGGNRWVSMALVHSLESQYVPDHSINTADVIVVLGGGTESYQSPRPMVEVNGAGDRMIYAYKLYRDGISTKILLSGGSAEWQGKGQSSPAEDMAFLLGMMGVPNEDLVLQSDSLNTFEDAQFSSRIIKENHWEKVVLITSALHMPRSVRLFKAAGVEVIPAPVDYTISDQEWRDLFSWQSENVLINILPTSGNLKSTTSSMKEYIGMFVNSLSED